MLKNQLDDAKDRESFYQNQIETMQRLLEAPKAPKMEDPTPVAPPQETIEVPLPVKPNEVESDIQTQNKRIPVPEHVEPEPKKRGFISRFFLPNG